MSDRIIAPINYPIIAGGKILKGGSVVFGIANVRPDPENPTTLKAVYLDSGLTIQAQNPQPISSDGVFDQSINGVLFGVTNDTYSVLIIDQNGKELSYIPEYSLSDANSAENAQQSAADAANSASQAASSESNAASSAASANSSLVEFTNTYWGEYASEPALSPNGEAATIGDLYFNTTTGGMLVYNGTQWAALSSAVNGLRSEQGFTNSMGQDTFSFDYDPNYVEAYLNGSKLVKGVDFDGTSGTQIVLSAPLVSNTDYLVLVAFNNVDFADLGTAAEADVQTSPTDATAGRLLNNETTHIGGNVNYTVANYQPEVSGTGIGVVRILKNNTGPSGDGSTTSGSNLELTYLGGAGTMIASGISPIGTWKQVAGFALSVGNFSWYVRVA